MDGPVPQLRLTQITLGGSALLFAGLLGSYIAFNSQLAFAQSADSFLDVFTAFVLAWTLRLSAIPRDANHHFGHSQAQPLGALVVAVLTGVLALEVIHRAAGALASGEQVKLHELLLVAFGIKAAFKAGVATVAKRALRSYEAPAVRALFVDARNDVLVGGLSILGFLAARYGWPKLDAWLALPLALYIGYSGFELAAENVRLLMGEAPPLARQRELLGIVRSLRGVEHADELRAHYLGTTLHIDVRVFVDPSLSVGGGRDIAQAVSLRLEREPDVDRCAVELEPNHS